MKRKAWITWERQTRNRSMSRRLDAKLFEFVSDKPRLRRYAWCCYRTVGIFRSRQFTTVFVQNPSIVLAILALILGRLYRTQVIVDAHNVAVSPDKKSSLFLKALTPFVLRNAELTIVSNHRLAKIVERQGGRAFPLADPLPSLDRTGTIDDLGNTFNVLYICTWSDDEPFNEVIDAARLLSDDYRIFITGRRPSQDHRSTPGNVTLTGFVSEERFVELLMSVDLVVDLTTREDCLVCGAYEAIASEQPLLLSDSLIGREVFGDAALYTLNQSIAIAAVIEKSRTLIATRRRMVREFKLIYDKKWLVQKDLLVNLMASPNDIM